METKLIILADPYKGSKSLPHGRVDDEKMHSSETSTWRPITTHFWESVESGIMAGGQHVCLGEGMGGKGRIWPAMGLKRAPTINPREGIL